ncbi:MAG: hypothetical protein M1469_07150 [Bacteroidetes bacterium]|nr:hypothetical protein [Bacteroidota bacterium]
MKQNSATVKSEDQLWTRANFGKLTWTHVIWLLIAWLTLFALGTLFVANPFWLEKSASAAPDYSHIMYLHSLLVGLAGVIVLIACEIFRVRSRRVRAFILFASVIATILVGLGGVFDAAPQIRWFWLTLHVIGFFSLDSIFIAFLIGMFQDLRAKTDSSSSLPYRLAIVSGFSLEIAALMGHAAGWILDFGGHPVFIGNWVRLVGETVNDFSGNLTTSHSHEIVVAMLSLLIAMVALRFGYQSLKGGSKSFACVGLWLVTAGTVIMTIMYVLGAFTSIEPPTLFMFGPNAANGLASDDLVTGIGVMIGGLMVLLTLLFKRKDLNVQSSWAKTALYSIATSWLLLVVTVVAAGYYIELHETVYGAGSQHAPAAISDAVYTFAHQDYAFFLIPGCIVLMLITNIVLKDREKGISRSLLTGLSVAFVGILTYAFVDPASVHGVGYIITTIGLFTIFVTTIFFLQRLWNVAFHEDDAGC